jgi:hypothetical protein
VLHEDAVATLDATAIDALEPSIHAGSSDVAPDVSRVARPGGGDMQQRVAHSARAFSFTPPANAGRILAAAAADQCSLLARYRTEMGSMDHQGRTKPLRLATRVRRATPP